MTKQRMPAVKTADVWKVFEHDGLAVEAVRGVSLDIEPGEIDTCCSISGIE